MVQPEQMEYAIMTELSPVCVVIAGSALIALIALHHRCAAPPSFRVSSVWLWPGAAA